MEHDAIAVMHAENSEVLPSGLVAVAVMTRSAGTDTPKVALKFTSPLLSVVTVVEPIYVSPSP